MFPIIFLNISYLYDFLYTCYLYVLYVLCFMCYFFEQDSNVRTPWHLHNERLFSNINSKYITVRSHRLLGLSTTTYSTTIVILNNSRDKSRLSLYYKKVNNSQCLTVESFFNCMYVEHMMIHSAKALYSNGHLFIYHKFKLFFLLFTSNTLQTWQKN